MLVLTRKVSQSIMIGDNIELSIVEIKGDQVRIGLTAPKNITIHRKEVYEEIKEENKRASTTRITELKEAIKDNKLK